MKKVAIIGAGISGLATAYQLHQECAVTIYEKQDFPGGHTDTHELDIDGRTLRIDSGFIIFCPQYYPHFYAMLQDLGVAYQATDMSFSAHNQQTGLVYNATSLNKLFCQRRNLLSPRFYRMLIDLLRFYARSADVLESDDDSLTVADYLTQQGYGDAFWHDHLLPMMSALWSSPPERVAQFPIRHLVDFFKAHGLLKVVGRPQWMVVKNGSKSYVEALQKRLKVDWRLGCTIHSVTRNNAGVQIHSDTGVGPEEFDVVVFATHSDQALTLLADPSQTETDVLGAIPFEHNHVVVHTDETLLHPNRQSWASWNTEVPSNVEPSSQFKCTANYWMNALQSLPGPTNVFTTLNSNHRIRADKILVERHYTHPVFTAASVAAQKRKAEIDGHQHTYYVGAYWGWGFHEDGARTAYQVSEKIKERLACTV
ncbi:dehydrogenase [Arenicella chitinivorans]|uniref:Dehydrogenase n=1 Tax=Arenicella chitinivorans TaxID=1329800 RepID=A0A918RZY6_9GAMM|nr:FAD-dependent oxidoreductase [Arenicella chitinivorans]GHA15340.1 dehydrogenase [Arenicella chitinivorans]